LTIIVVGVVSLGVAAEVLAPTTLARHMASMEAAMGGAIDGMMTDLTVSFRQARPRPGEYLCHYPS
jgi:hypothetical protein